MIGLVMSFRFEGWAWCFKIGFKNDAFKNGVGFPRRVTVSSVGYNLELGLKNWDFRNDRFKHDAVSIAGARDAQVRSSGERVVSYPWSFEWRVADKLTFHTSPKTQDRPREGLEGEEVQAASLNQRQAGAGPGRRGGVGGGSGGRLTA